MNELFQYLKLNNLTISTCESFTGGYFANEITNIQGVSQYYKGSFVCYSDEYKINVLDIDIEIIKKYSSVSKEVLNLMLKNTYKKLKTDIVLAFTGFAPPKDDNPKSGLSYIGFKKQDNISIFEFKVDQDITREQYKNKACNFLIDKLLNS
ncbi:CinA family protein [Spiroplasma diminutum]|uniref:Competence damage-inducible protein A n=1 Tax=Spiroplasma diminutum CUAS-1 TaxID=1276221 RepID=S5LVV5_9MOLU|nr:nicotinamide-nucleotide amidohydrolase family protein [Spiroplasma diminutum]AGR41964.1 competence damage-inducible protein A [Spiroplasma diminutum CUAS-1]